MTRIRKVDLLIQLQSEKVNSEVKFTTSNLVENAKGYFSNPCYHHWICSCVFVNDVTRTLRIKFGGPVAGQLSEVLPLHCSISLCCTGRYLIS